MATLAAIKKCPKTGVRKIYGKKILEDLSAHRGSGAGFCAYPLPTKSTADSGCRPS